MNLIASMVIRNELGRYLPLCIEHLLEFCDRVLILDDGSDDGTREWLLERSSERLLVGHWPESQFYVHEGRTRQRLLEMTLALGPTHVLSIDADEFVEGGERLRARVEGASEVPVWSLAIQEVWKAEAGSLCMREDGGWRTHPINVLWKVPADGLDAWRVMDRPLACGRIPVPAMQARATVSGAGLLHFGWTNEATRLLRYQRYVLHDNGRFHRSAHLRSIMLPESRMRFRRRAWPADPVFAKIRDTL